MANVKFYMSGGNYPTPDTCEAGALYFNYKVGTIYYGADKKAIANLSRVSTNISSTDRCVYKIASYTDEIGTQSLYGKRCETKEVSIHLTTNTPPLAVGDSTTVSKTLAETDLGGMFVGFDVVDFTSGATVPGKGWDDFWSLGRAGVQIGNTTSGGTASYKVSVRVSCIATVPNNAMTNIGSASVKVRVYYIPF